MLFGDVFDTTFINCKCYVDISGVYGTLLPDAGNGLFCSVICG